MNVEQAFQTLFASMAAALNESLARHAQAAQQGDLKALDVEIDVQHKLVAARNQLQGLRAMWPSLVEQPAAARPKTPPAEQPDTEGPIEERVKAVEAQATKPLGCRAAHVESETIMWESEYPAWKFEHPVPERLPFMEVKKLFEEKYAENSFFRVVLGGVDAIICQPDWYESQARCQQLKDVPPNKEVEAILAKAGWHCLPTDWGGRFWAPVKLVEAQ